MVDEKRIMQGHAYDFSIDTTGIGSSLDAIGAQIYSGGIVVADFRYPHEEGFEELIPDGVIYSGVLKSSITDNMLGVYGIIPYIVIDDDIIKKGFNPEFVEVIQKPV